MKRRILSLFLAVMSLLPSPLLSASAAPTGRIDGVDYGCIDENVNLRMKVEFDIGEAVRGLAAEWQDADRGGG